MTTIPILETLDNIIPKESQKQLDNVHRLECEEVLDNLGYVKLNRNDNNLELDPKDFKKAIKEFRQEYGHSYKTFNNYDDFSMLELNTLSEAEIEFMQTLSSLENEFNLHKYSLNEIASNMLLSRVLTYRLNILSIFSVETNNQLPVNIELALNQLKIWCNKSNTNEIIELLGDIDKLSETLVFSNNNSDTLLHYFAFFDAQEKRFKMPELSNGSNWEYFKEKFQLLKETKYSEILTRLKYKSGKIKLHKDNPLNQLQLRVIQIRLWLLGTYEGELDNDIGPLTVDAIQNVLAQLFDNSNSKANEYLLRNLIFYIAKDTWVINVNFLFMHIFPIFLDNENTTDKIPETFSEKIMQIVDKLNRQEDKDAIFSDIKKRVEKTSDEITKRKVKTRSSKSFLKSLRKFFSQLLELIKEGIDKIKEFLSKLFSRIKNSVRILVREFKKVINMIKTAMCFFFSKRKVRTGNNKNGIYTNYDFNFDNYSLISSVSKKQIGDHIQKINYIAKSMKETSDFLGPIINILIKVIKGPYGWIQLCLEVIKYLFNTNFKFNILIFRTFN